MDERPILLIEDCPDDAFLTLREMKKHNIANVIVKKDGVDALNYLFQLPTYPEMRQSLLPKLIILDLNLPRINGMEFLEEIRTDERTGDIPVVILTSSLQDRDFARCRELGAVEYLQKPIDAQKLVHLIKNL